MKNALALLFAITVAVTLVSAPAPTPQTSYFKVLDTGAGLPDNSVNAIAEDSLGFIWAGTWNGLSRFDGKHPYNYVHKDNDPYSLTNNMVRAVLAIDGGLFVGSDGGLDYFSFDDNRFYIASYIINSNDEPQLLTRRVSRLYKNKDHILALTIDGKLLRLLPESLKRGKDGLIRPVFRQIPSPGNRRYADLCPYEGDRIFAVSNEGFSVISDDGEHELYHNAIASGYDPNMNIYYDRLERVLYSGGGLGMNQGAFRLVSPEGRLEPDPTISVTPSLMQTVADEEYIYQASDGHGLSMHRRGGGGRTDYTPDNSSLPGDAIYTLFIDSRGNVWLGTYRRGLCLFSPELNHFTIANKKNGRLSYDIVTAILPTADKLYVGLDGGGLDIYDRATGKITNLSAENSDLPGNNIVSLQRDGNTLYMAVYAKGLTAYDMITGRFTPLPDLDWRQEPGKKVWTMLAEGDGRLWIGGQSLQLYDKAHNSYLPVEGGKDVGVNALADDGKRLWAATRYEGLLEIDKKSRKVVARHSDSPSPDALRLPTHNFDNVSIDSRGNVWFAAPDKGLYCMKQDSTGRTTLHTYGPHEGIMETRVQVIAEDAAGDLYMGTTNGLYKYMRSNNKFVRITDSRLPSQFTANATARFGDIIYMGTTNGILTFPARGTATMHDVGPVNFTSLSLIGSKREPLKMLGRDVGPVTLEADENFFTIAFTVPEMVHPESVVLEYMLEGFDTDWRESDDSRTATYTNVPPGDYRFLVRHNTPEGGWSEPVSMEITIRYPWYLRWWALLIWVAAFLTSLVLIFHIRHRYNASKNRALRAEMERNTARELNNAKLDFYANITHELRTPCFLITAQIEEMLDSPKESVRPSSLQGIYRNSLKLNRLITHLIDFRKLDSGIVRLRPRHLDLTKFVESLEPDYRNLCAQKNISFKAELPGEPVEGSFDPDKIELILSNLVSNAFKYTKRDGHVTLTLTATADTVTMSVADDGIGIIENKQEAIFTPYYRTDRGRRQSTGDGIGLSFVKELVDLQGGTITVQSEVNHGSVFTVTLPRYIKRDNNDNEPDTPYEPMPLIHNEVPPTEPEVTNPTATRSMLIVDDDPEVGQLLSRNFYNDFRLTRTTDPAEGLEMALTGKYDIVITDLMMPGTDGLALISAIRSKPELNNVKIVVLSASNSEDDMLKALDSGVSAFLTKPISLKVLTRQINKLFEPSTENLSLLSASPVEANFSKEEQRFLVECRRIIDECMTDENFGIEMLASRLAMSHSSLYKKIRRMTGMSLVEFINEYRIFKAVNLFREGNTNVQRVSEMCGFRDIKTFRESFKRKMQMPPKQYIQSLNK